MYDFKAKEQALLNANNYSLNKTLSMFEWVGLPDSIPAVELEKCLQVSGYAFMFKHTDGELYALTGGLGGLSDVYGNPTEIIIVNPALGLTKTFKISEGVLIRNDDLMMGVKNLLNKFNSLLVENDLSMLINTYATRMQLMISASDDKTRASVDRYLEKLVDGDLAAIGENALFDGIKKHSEGTTNNTIKNLIEFHQYIKAGLFNELGLNASFNMKRERLNTSEVEQNDDNLYPFVDNMMKCRTLAISEIAEKFDLDLEVAYGSIWAVKNARLTEDENTTNEGLENEQEEPVNLGTDFNDSSESLAIEEEQPEEQPETLDGETVAGEAETTDAEPADSDSETVAEPDDSDAETEAETVADSDAEEAETDAETEAEEAEEDEEKGVKK